MGPRSEPAARPEPQLVRGIGVGGATVLNMIDMIGVGPFITIPLIVSAVGGPQAMFGWIAGAVLAICDGLVWAELGAAMPRSGGSYRYLSEIYGPRGLGRLLSFLFIWQLSFSAPLSIASGCIGLAQYASYLSKPLGTVFWSRSLVLNVPVLGTLSADVVFSCATLVAIAACALAALLLYRNTRSSLFRPPQRILRPLGRREESIADRFEGHRDAGPLVESLRLWKSNFQTVPETLLSPGESLTMSAPQLHG